MPVEKELVYDSAFPENCRLDLFVPENIKQAPGVLLVHGGGWRAGDKTQWHALAEKLSNFGFVAASATYRLAPGHRFPAQIEDVRKAMGWFKNRLSQMGGNPQKVAAVGSSAGGHLVALLATISASDPLGLSPQLADPDTRPKAAVCYNPILNFLETPVASAPDHHNMYLDLFGGTAKSMEAAYRQASPALRLTGNEPPFLLLNGSDDTLTPSYICRNMVESLMTVGVSAEFAEFQGMKHGFGYELNHPEQIRASDTVLEFLKKTLFI